MPEWFYQIGEREFGPVSESELLYLYSNSQITARTAIRATEQSTWTTAAELLHRHDIRKPAKRQSQSVPTNGREPGGDHRQLVDMSGEPDIPAPPPLPDLTSADDLSQQHRHLIGGAAVGGLALLLLLIWLLWPVIAGSAGGAGRGTGYADQGDGTDTAASPQSGTHSTPTEGDSLFSASGTQANGPDTNLTVPDGTSTPSAPGPIQQSAGSGHTPQPAGSTQADTSLGMAGTTGRQTDQTPQADGALTAPLDPTDSPVPDPRFAVNAPGEATFFGIRSSGRRFLFVVDCSGSMSGSRLDRAKAELCLCLERLPASVHFNIVFFDDSLQAYLTLNSSTPMQRASRKNKNDAVTWVNSISPGGGTDVQLAMNAALSVHPAADVIFLLTDGQFDPTTPDVVRLRNVDKARVNTIAFETREGEPLLQQIARESHGDYRFVP